MLKNEKEQRIYELTALLNNYRNAYYTGEELVSNFEYDTLYDELTSLENETGITLSDSPTQTVGIADDRKILQKVTHEIPALSLDKTKDIEVLKKWLGDKEGVLSWKLDGLTLQLTYKTGKLVQAVTRGNGEIGEDVTHMATHPSFIGIPQKIDYLADIVIRGEVVMTYSDFEMVNSKMPAGEQYKNPRNLAAGTLRSLDGDVLKERPLRFVAFELVKEEIPDYLFKHNEQVVRETSFTKQLMLLTELGFKCVDHVWFFADNAESIIRHYEKDISTLWKTEEIADIPVDGLVITFEDVAYGKSLGSTSHHARSGMAFKFQDEERETTVREIFWSASKTGLINPVAVFDEVELEGTSVTRASVHNLTILENLGCGVGSTVKVYKANMIIPQISTTVEKAPIKIPTNCPVCGHPTRVENGKNGSKFLYCDNEVCNVKKQKKFERFCERNAMDIAGISESTIETFLEKGFIREFHDLFSIKNLEDKVVGMEGFGKKKFDNIVKAIEDSKNVKMSKFLYALGIENFGKDASKIVSKAMGMNEFLEKVESGFSFQEFDGIGEVIEQSLYDWMNNSENKAELQMLINVLSIEDEVMEAGEAKFAGLTFVITGSVNHFQNRDEIKAVIESKGGKVAGSVSKKTNYLINNDNSSTTGKNKKAQELNIPIITEEDFLAML